MASLKLNITAFPLLFKKPTRKCSSFKSSQVFKSRGSGVGDRAGLSCFFWFILHEFSRSQLHDLQKKSCLFLHFQRIMLRGLNVIYFVSSLIHASLQISDLSKKPFVILNPGPDLCLCTPIRHSVCFIILLCLVIHISESTSHHFHSPSLSPSPSTYC